MSIPTELELIEKFQVRTTVERKKSVGHLAVEARSSEQDVVNYLIDLGMEVYERDGKRRKVSKP